MEPLLVHRAAVSTHVTQTFLEHALDFEIKIFFIPMTLWSLNGHNAERFFPQKYCKS